MWEHSNRTQLLDRTNNKGPVLAGFHSKALSGSFVELRKMSQQQDFTIKSDFRSISIKPSAAWYLFWKIRNHGNRYAMQVYFLMIGLNMLTLLDLYPS